MKESSRKVFFAFISLFMIFALYIPIHSIKLNNVQGAESSTIVVWVNDGGNKITQDELRAFIDSTSVINSVYPSPLFSILVTVVSRWSTVVGVWASRPFGPPDLTGAAFAGRLLGVSGA